MTQAAPTPTPPATKKAAKQDRELLTKLLRSKLNEPCPVGLLPPSMQMSLSPGGKAPTFGDAVVHQLVEAAVVDKREWAIEQILDRTEGKPVQAIRNEDTDRSTEEKLNDVTAKLLNRFASGAPAAKPPVAASSPADAQAAAPGSSNTRLLHLPKHGPNRPQDPADQSGVASTDPVGGGA